MTALSLDVMVGHHRGIGQAPRELQEPTLRGRGRGYSHGGQNMVRVVRKEVQVNPVLRIG